MTIAANGHDLIGPHTYYDPKDDNPKPKYWCSKCGDMFDKNFVLIHFDLIQPCEG